jgi:hypothetical protein
VTDDQDHKGYANAVTTVVALIGILWRIHPKWAWIGELAHDKDEVEIVLGTAFPILGTIGAAITKPNAKIHGWLLDARAWLASFFRRKPVP